MLRRHCLILLTLIQFSTKLNAQQASNDMFAKHILQESISLRKGDIVTVYGGIHASPLIESIVSETNAAGGFASSIFTTDSIEKSKLRFPPGNKMFQSELLQMLRPTQYLIILDPLVADPAYVQEGILPEQESVGLRADQDLIKSILKKRVRILRVAVPTPSAAKNLNRNLDEYQEMVWRASMMDINTMLPNMNRLKGLLKNASRIRITTSSGTDFTFSIQRESRVVKDGRITNEETSNPALNVVESLPAGIIELTVNDRSGNGKVLLPFIECDYKQMKEVSFQFKDGRVEDFAANEGGQCFASILQDGNFMNSLGSVSFCFNWALKVIERDGGRYWRDGELGIVWVTMGNNDGLGGLIPSKFRNFSFPIVGASVEIDGKVALKSK